MQNVETPSRLSRLQAYLRDHPLTAWWVCVTIFALFYTPVFLVPGEKKPGTWFFIASTALFIPTFQLALRFSDEQLAEHPVSERQINRVGLMFLFFLTTSIGAIGFVSGAKRIGWHLTDNQGFGAIMLFSFSTMLSMAFGYCARHTPIGKIGFKLMAAWWGLIGLMFVLALFLHKG